MKKTMKQRIVLAFLGLTSAVLAQEGRVGINTDAPKATLDIAKKDGLPVSQVQGAILPHISSEERNKFTNVEKGTMIYNTTKNCIDWFDGTTWQCMDGTQRDASPLEIPTSLKILEDKTFIASAYDTNYRPYTNPTSVATWDTNVNPDTTGEDVINYQGKITTEGFWVRIPVEATASGNLPAYATSVKVDASKTQDGQSRMLELSWSAQSYDTTTKYILAHIKSVGGDLLVKKLDTNAGIGVDAQGGSLADFAININDNSAIAYHIRAIGVIPDRCYGKTTLECVGYGAAVKEHQFLYVPMQGPDGAIWLNNNLGAGYAKVDENYFNPIHQGGALDAGGSPLMDPTADQIKQDWRAYGSLFQWQRNPDGHELINWSNATSGTPKYNSPTTTLSSSWTNPNTNQFIKSNSSSDFSWVNNSLNNASTQKDLWQTNGSTNPCPSGYHVHTHTEQMALHVAIIGKYIGTNNSNTPAMWNETGLRLPASGARGVTGRTLYNQTFLGYFWSSEQSDIHKSWTMWVDRRISGTDDRHNRAIGYSVRCLKD